MITRCLFKSANFLRLDLDQGNICLLGRFRFVFSSVAIGLTFASDLLDID